jgi:hypothetical protein
MFTYFSTTELGEEVTSEMLSYHPARDVEEPVTKEFLRGELALTRLELRTEMGTLREELRGEMGTLREEMRGEMKELGKELHAEMTNQFLWLMSTMLVILGVLATLIVALH